MVVDILGRVKKSQIKQYMRCISRFGESKVSRKEFFRILRRKIEYRHMICVYIKDDKIVGTATLIPIPKFLRNGSISGQIEDVCVDPDYEHQGIGREMMLYLIEKAKKWRMYKVVLDCSEDNVPFYESCGFHKKEQQMRIDLALQN